ncbi:MAG: hypothetical protein WBP85_04865 [Terracidiphilus sp.]
MLKTAQFPLQCADIPLSPLGSRQIAAEMDRRDINARLAAMHVSIHKERRARFYGNLFSLWPVALGVGMSFCSTSLCDAAGNYAPLVAKLLFPLSFLAAQHEMHLGPDAMPALSQVMLFAQFPLDGLLVCMLLRQRSNLLSVCGQVALFHVLFLVCIGWVTGSFRGIMAN